MSVTLEFRLVDHERLVVRALPVVNAAIREQDADILRRYLSELPVEVSPEVVEYRELRVAKLRELRAPEIIIQNEERQLRVANGEAFRAPAFAKATLNELRELLGQWCWLTYDRPLLAWRPLQWFLQPGVGPSNPLTPEPPEVGDPKQSLLDQALDGSEPYPVDDLGDPIIRTCGNRDSSAYNPPDRCVIIRQALAGVDPTNWEQHVPLRCDLYQRGGDNTPAEIEERVQEELSDAREGLATLISLYSEAADAGFGVSCEYTL